MKYLIFGTGDYYNRYKKWFECREIVALLDNSKQKQHTIIDGFEVLPPEEGVKLQYDSIIILSFCVKQMKQQLLSLGVCEDKIYHFYDLAQLFAFGKTRIPLQYYLNAEEIIYSQDEMKSKVLLISTDLTLGGPSIALFHAAVILKKQGYKVVYASMWDGALREKLIEQKIPVVVDENLPISTMRQTKWVNTFSLILCNTLNFYVFLSERDTTIPIVWWFHDARFFYDGVNRKIMRQISLNHLKAVSVGPVPETAVREFLPDLACEELLYGVKDAADGRKRKCDSSILRFVTIGFLEDIKGQDILLKAVLELPDCIRHRCAFYIVGHNDTLFGEKIKNESAKMQEMIFTGRVSREKIHALLADADVLICPSKQDAMPTVAAEAMMHSVPCIVSDATGTAAYITDGRDGFVFQSENVQMLKEKIAWCAANRDRLDEIGRKARELYEGHFSMTAFEKRFMEIVEGVRNEVFEWKLRRESL